MKAKVLTSIDGIQYTFVGNLSKCGKILHCKKGMILTIQQTDIVTIQESKKQTEQTIYKSEIYKWFKATKQIK